MSEKRFFVKVYSSNEPFFFDTKQKYFEQGYTCEDVVLKPMSIWQVVDLLNDMNNVIGLLKPTNLEQYEQIQRLQEENEQLREELGFSEKYSQNLMIKEREYMSEKRFSFFNERGSETIFTDNSRMMSNREIVDLLNQLSEENEQLRNSIKAFLEEADMFSENATDHDIVAYRELNKFDNKDAYYLACAIAELKKVIDDE